MDSDRLNQWLSLGANIAVLIGIGLLVIELNQNHDMMRAQTRSEISQHEITLLGLMSGNKELVELLIKAGQNSELSEAEQYRVVTHSESTFRLWQNVHYQGRNDLYDQEEFQKHIETMRNVMSHSPWLVEYWCNSRMLYPEEFASEIDRLVPANSCRN